MGSSLITPSGGFIDLDNIDEDLINIHDIAHGLSMQCRWNGATPQFYSVAEHSVLLADWLMDQGCSKAIAKLGLLHDSPEYILGDTVRPVKALMQEDYEQLEHRVWLAIKMKIGCSDVESYRRKVFEADDRITTDERLFFWPHTKDDKNWTNKWEPLGVKILCLPPMQAKLLFLKTWEKLND